MLPVPPPTGLLEDAAAVQLQAAQRGKVARKEVPRAAARSALKSRGAQREQECVSSFGKDP